MQRLILHLDLDAFFCSVEELLNPTLAGKAFAVGGSPDSRGVVASCSYAAREHGIHSAMPMKQAIKFYPELHVVRGNYREYSKYSSSVMKILRELTPLVEQISIDEAFMDITDQRIDGKLFAEKLHTRILNETGLPSSIGVASNKLLAKTANEFGKSTKIGISPPNAITIVVPGEEAKFLSPLPVRMLWGIGPKTSIKLAEIGINTIGDLSRISEDELVRRFGMHGKMLFKYSHGIDNSPILTKHEIKSVSHETTFSSDVSERDVLYRTIRSLSESIARRLRKYQKKGKTIKLKIRWPDFSTYTRQLTVNIPTDQEAVIITAALQLLTETWHEGQPVRLIGIGVSGFESDTYQLSLWDSPTNQDQSKRMELQKALDDLRDRFGMNAIRRASEITNR